MLATNPKVPNETFLSIALQAEARPGLSDIGKAFTVMICFLAAALEQGATDAEINMLLQNMKAAVTETASRVIAETAHHADS